MSTHQFLVMWDMYGLECCEDITAASQLKVWNTLRGIPNDTVRIPNLMHLRLRAQINSQRNYEIYVIDVEAGITVSDITAMFEANPQESANTIRRQGHCVYRKHDELQQVIV